MVKLSIEAIIPGKPVKGTEYDKAIRAALGRFLERVRTDLKSPTRTWETVVVFHSKTTEEGTKLVGEVTTDSQVYAWVNEGTKPHIIRPKKARALRFQWGGYGSYKAKTIPGSLGSRSGGSSGDIVYRMEVKHPGFVGRHFTETIVKKRGDSLQTEVQKAIDSVNARTR